MSNVSCLNFLRALFLFFPPLHTPQQIIPSNDGKYKSSKSKIAIHTILYLLPTVICPLSPLYASLHPPPSLVSHREAYHPHQIRTHPWQQPWKIIPWRDYILMCNLFLRLLSSLSIYTSSHVFSLLTCFFPSL